METQGTNTQTLSWINKQKAIYYEMDENGIPSSPIWIDIKDPRFQKAHELTKLNSIGDQKSSNRLIHGDNLFSLQCLQQEFSTKPEKDRIKCIYIDPPYNTGCAFSQYDDNFQHSEWLGLLHPRIQLLRNLLRKDGTIFVQVDDNEFPYLEMLMNEIFGEANKIATIIWRRRQSQANLSKTISTIHDYIVVYARDKTQCALSKIEHTLWIDPNKFGHNQQASKEMELYFGDTTLFDTPKPETLIYHILSLATESGDWVLDSFSGSGTTIAVAHKMNRKWIAIEMNRSSFNLNITRISKIIDGKIQTELDSLIKWQGGGGFTTYQLREIKKGHKEKRGEREEEFENLIQTANKYIGDLELNWNHKHQVPYFSWQEINLQQTSKNKISWVDPDYYLIAEKRVFSPVLNIEKENTNKKIPNIVKTYKNSNFQIIAEPLESLQSLPNFLDTYLNVPKVQSILFCPPIAIQDLTLSKLTPNQFYSWCRYFFIQLKTILMETGFIIIHTYERHVAEITIILDEIYGRNNHIGTFLWDKGINDSENKSYQEYSSIIKKYGEYGQSEYDCIILYCKDPEHMTFYQLPPDPSSYSNPDNDPRGPWNSMPLVASKKASNDIFTYTFTNGISLTKKWRYPPNSIKKLEDENRLHFTNPKSGKGIPRVKKFYSERIREFEELGERGITPNSILCDPSQFGSLGETIVKHRNEINKLPFRNEKLYQFLLQLTTKEQDYVFDPFDQLGIVGPIATALLRHWITINPDYQRGWRISNQDGENTTIFQAKSSIFRGLFFNPNIPTQDLAQAIFLNFGFTYHKELPYPILNEINPIQISKTHQNDFANDFDKLSICIGMRETNYGIMILHFPAIFVTDEIMQWILKSCMQLSPKATNSIYVFTNCGINLNFDQEPDFHFIKLPYALSKKFSGLNTRNIEEISKNELL